jgi:hypothetical protein
MKRWFRFFLLPLAFTLCAPVALAQLTVATDQAKYLVGDVVRITIHNAGPGVATFTSYPGYLIVHVESGLCVAGCVGLPVLWELPAGDLVKETHATGAGPDPAGIYLVTLLGTSPDPGSVLKTSYVLNASVPARYTPWGSIKSLYR